MNMNEEKNHLLKNIILMITENRFLFPIQLDDWDRFHLAQHSGEVRTLFIDAVEIENNGDRESYSLVNLQEEDLLEIHRLIKRRMAGFEKATNRGAK